MIDEILEELWKSKDEVAQEYRYNIDKLVEGLRKKEKGVKATVVDLTSARKNVLNNELSKRRSYSDSH